MQLAIARRKRNSLSLVLKLFFSKKMQNTNRKRNSLSLVLIEKEPSNKTLNFQKEIILRHTAQKKKKY